MLFATFICFSLILHAQVSKTLNITAGGLYYYAITAEEKSTITNLTLTGTINAMDFKVMRDEMPLLAVIDLSGVTIVGYTGFQGTSFDSNVTYPANTIPDYSFCNTNTIGKVSLTTLILPSTIKSIGYSAFKNCSGLTSVNIPSTLVSFGSEAFYNCTKLTSIQIPPLATSIGTSAFYNCTVLTSINIPSLVTSIGSSAFSNCTKVSSIQVDSPVPINLDFSSSVFSGINKSTATLKVPIGSKTTYQAAYQWKDFLNITEMPGFFISDNSIDLGAYSGTAKLSIASSSDWSAVSDQGWLTLSPASGSTGTSILNLTFTANQNNTNRTAIITVSATGFDSKIIKVNQYSRLVATAGNLKLLLGSQLSTITSLTLSGTIDARDFKTMRDDMPLLAEIDLSAATVVEYNGSNGTTYPDYSENPAYAIPVYAFSYYNNRVTGKKLTNIILPQSCKTIGNYAFAGCYALTSFDIPSSVTSIGSYAFHSCASLSSIVLPLSVESIGEAAFYFCNGLTSINISSSIRTIGNNVFGNCSKLTSIVIPSSVTIIGNAAFEGCSGLTSINIPSSVKSIGSSAFGSCTKLSSIQSNSFLPIDLSSSSYTFIGINTATTILKVPFGSKTAYKAANQWNDFKNIVEMPGFFLSTGSVGMGTVAGTAKISITSSTVWTAVSDQYWLTLSPASGTAGSSSLELTATANSGTANRKATITISSKDFDSQTITVTQYCKVEVTAGNLKTLFASQLSTITHLTVIGTIDARDFKTMRDDMPSLVVADLSGATIVEYYGMAGTYGNYIYSYLANTIPTYSFYNLNSSLGKTSLQNAILPSSITSIEPHAFQGCIGLTSISLPSSVTSIGSYAFQHCSALSLITIPTSVISIGSYVFADCSNLTSIDIPTSVSTIESYTFQNCSSLNSITIPTSITSIKSYAFQNCTSLTSVNIPLSVTSIGTYAFGNCSKVSSIQVNSPIPINLDSSPNAFYNINKITTVLNVPFGSKAAYQAATQWKDFQNIVEASGLFLSNHSIGMDQNAGTSEISVRCSSAWTASSDQDWLTVSPISGEAGTGKLILTATSNPDTTFRKATVTVSASGIESQNITVTQSSIMKVTPGKLKTLLTNKLSTVTYLTITGTIDASDFKTMRDDMPSLISVDLSKATIVNYEGLEGTYDSSIHTYPANTVPDCSFYNRISDVGKTSLKSIVLPSSIISVGSGAFAKCNGLTSINIPSGVTSIQNTAFNSCSGLKSITISPSVTSIGDYAFGYCTGLTSVSIPSSVTSIGYGAFQECRGLMSINIPSSVTYISNFAFYRCIGLTSVTIPPTITSIGNDAFNGCTGLTTMLVPQSVTTIGDAAFAGCTGLTSINIPTSVTTIGMNAFNYCIGLTSITIPQSVTSIGRAAFAVCNKLEFIQANSNIPVNLSNSGDVFMEINKATTVLKVPSGSKAAYKAAYQWRDFVNIVELPGLILSKNAIGMGPNAEKINIAIASSTSWTAISDQEWLTVSPGSGASGNGSLALTTTVYSGSTARTATITVSATGVEPQIITVTQYAKIEVTAGNLKNLLAGKLSSITSIALTGTIDARDFKTMRDDMPILAIVDLSEATIVEYTGTEGPLAFDVNFTYRANTVPYNSFSYSGFNPKKINLTTVVLPSSITSIESSSFTYCTGLTSINIPSSVAYIGSNAFYYCTGLTSINIPSSVTHIGAGAYENCSGLTSLNIPSTVTNIDGQAFANCNNVRSIQVNSSKPINLT